MLRLIFLVLTLWSVGDAFLFPMGGGCGGCGGGGGGGCGCPMLPPPCPPPMLPMPCLPQLPMPCLPQLPMPCLPMLPSCGCGGRKKREAGTLANDATKCTDSELRKIIVKNLGGDIKATQEAIYSAAKSHLNSTEIAVFCQQGQDLKFASNVETFCIDGSNQRTCGIFRLD